MTRNTNLRGSAAVVLTATAIVAFVLITESAVLAQGTFAVGQQVMASPEMLKDEKYYKPCTVVKFDSTANAYLLNCEGAKYLVQAAYIRVGKPEAVSEKKPDATVAAPPKEEGPQVPKPENKGDGKIKVGDRVLASPMMLKADKHYQPCTVISINPPNSYGLRCDPFGGISFEEYSVREDFVRPWKGATPAPTFECSLEQPPAVNTKVASASPALFKRLIYEFEAATEPKTTVGIKFESFQIGRTFRNVYDNSTRGLLVVDSPQNATIYPVKTKFVRCVEGTSYNMRSVVEVGFYCAKNRFGEWGCGAGGGVRNVSDPQRVPRN